MLDPLPVWTDALSKLAPAMLTPEGAKKFAAAVGTLTNKVQAGDTGLAGILTFNEPIFATQLSALVGSAGPEWATKMATAWQTALLASIVKPGTVKDPAWTASVVDATTLPTAAASIPTIPVGFAQLQSGLAAVAAMFQNPDIGKAEAETGPEKIAKAFRDATLSLKFICIGLVLAPPSPPIPLPKSFAAK